MHQRKKGDVHTIILAIAVLLVAAFTLTAGAKEVTKSVVLNFEEITQKTTINIYNELLLISTTEQGVKYYDTKKKFIINLNSTHIELKYNDKTGTMADDQDTHYTYAMRHDLKNIVETQINAPAVDRICISKKIVNCVPQITICLEGQTCCTISPNMCKTVK